MKHIFLSLVALTVALPVLSQKKFLKDGYVVTTNGDTVRGSIMDKDWDQNPKLITLSKADGQKLAFSPLEIRSAVIEGRRFYKSAILQVDKSPFEVKKIGSTPASTFIQLDTVFLEVIVENSNISLYRLNDENNKLHFFLNNHGETFELTQRYLKVKNAAGTDALFIQKVFQEQIKKIAGTCLSKKAIDALEYRESSLRNAVNTLNKCQSGTDTFTQKREKIQTQLVVSGGIAWTSYSFSGVQHFAVPVVPDAAGPTLGLGIDFVLPRNNRQQSVYVDLLYKPFSSTSDDINNNDASIELTYLKLTAFYRYTLKTTRIKPFFQLGLSNGLVVDHNLDRFNTLRKNEQGLAGGIGLYPVDRLSCEFRFEKSNGFSDSRLFVTKGTTAYLLVSYRF